MQEKAQNMANVAKTQDKPTISKSDCKRIARAYHQLYFAFLLKNLMSGMTLGASAHKAMQMVRAKLSTMDKNNPVTRVLLRIHAEHSKRMAKRIMTSKHRDARAVVRPDQIAKINMTISKLTNSALSVFKSMSAQYAPKQNVTENTDQRQLFLLIKMKQLDAQRQRGRAA